MGAAAVIVIVLLSLLFLICLEGLLLLLGIWKIADCLGDLLKWLADVKVKIGGGSDDKGDK